MAPKNKKKNGFYFFMKEMQERESARGYNISIKNMPNIAHPLWKQLSDAEREQFENMAKQYNKDPTSRGGKMASDGTRIEDNLREEEEKKWLLNSMKQDVQQWMNVTAENFKEVMPRKLLYFMTFNILCHTKDDDVYIPIEIGLIEYSIKNGIHKEYTKIIYPGRPPTGYAGTAKDLSENTHEIDIFGVKESERDIRAVYQNIKDFINPQNLLEQYPPIFCEESYMDITNGCLDWLAEYSGEPNVFRVRNAVHLLLELRNGVGEALPSEVIASDILNKTSFNYHPSTRCNFHEEKDNHYCALAYSKRLCYLLSDAVVTYFDLPLTERHIPNLAEEEKPYSITQYKESRCLYSNASRPLRLDKSNNYYQNRNSDDENIQNPNISTDFSRLSTPRQPTSICLAEQMSQLQLKSGPPTAPHAGVGRGIRRK